MAQISRIFVCEICVICEKKQGKVCEVADCAFHTLRT